MKKVILSLAAVFAFGLANAQDSQMRFGVKAGLNMSTLTGDAEASSLVGAHIGGFMEYKLNDKFAIQPELLFSMQGAKVEMADFSDPFDPIVVEEDYKLNYLNLPIMAKYYATEKFTVEAGPQVGFLMSAKFGDEDAKDGLKSVDFGMNLGLGYDFTENFSAGARYNFGLSDINDVDGAGKASNGVFSLSAGYKF